MIETIVISYIVFLVTICFIGAVLDILRRRKEPKISRLALINQIAQTYYYKFLAKK